MLRYGENPHQAAALYVDGTGGLAGAEQLHGKEMSYNNYVDTDAARRAALGFDEPAVAIIKHANPCGIAVGADVAEAYRRANECDPTSAFGGVIAVNRPVSVAMAEELREIFTEAIVAPAYDEGAVEVLQSLPRGGRTSGSSSATTRATARRPSSGRSAGESWSRCATTWTPTVTTRRRGPSRPVKPRRTTYWPISRSRGRPAGR